MMNILKEVREARQEEGFTLIELMVVVVIIGILAAIAIPIFTNQQKGAIGASLKSDVKNTVGEVSNALTKTPTAPDLSTLVEVVETPGNTTTVSGGWDSFVVRSVNPDGDPACWEYSSSTGKSQECSAGNAGGASGSAFNPASIVMTFGNISRTFNDGSSWTEFPSDSAMDLDDSGVVRFTSSPIETFQNGTGQSLGMANGQATVVVGFDAEDGYHEEILQVDVVDGQIVGNPVLPQDFVEASKGTRYHSAPPYIRDVEFTRS